MDDGPYVMKDQPQTQENHEEITSQSQTTTILNIQEISSKF